LRSFHSPFVVILPTSDKSFSGSSSNRETSVSAFYRSLASRPEPSGGYYIQRNEARVLARMLAAYPMFFSVFPFSINPSTL